MVVYRILLATAPLNRRSLLEQWTRAPPVSNRAKRRGGGLIIQRFSDAMEPVASMK